jgi:hypothetical protein
VRRAWPILVLLVVGGCAYYNGMYNTKRLAGRARKAEREGRPFEATGLWNQVAVKAESVAIKHPSASWSDEARLLSATALAKLNQCPRAVRSLEAVAASARDPKVAEEAALMLGSCRLQEGDAEGASVAYVRLLNSRDPSRRSLARYQHGRALRLSGQFDAALAELSTSTHPHVRGERAAALAGSGQIPEALVLADSLLAERDTVAPWDSLLSLVAERDPEAAERLTDRIAGAQNMPPALRARLLVLDAQRSSESNPARSAQRLQQADSLGEGSPIQAEARLEQTRIMLTRVATLDELLQALARLDASAEDGARLDGGQAQLEFTARRVVTYADSIPAGAPFGDLRLFVAGEIARDSLNAPALAASQFKRVASDWPDSPFAPKAMLALILLDPARADSLREALLARYPDNPYVALAQGGDSPGYEVLEDSLRRFGATFRPGGRPVRAAPARRQPTQQPATPREPAPN